jgi:RNA polymerase sigma-70 factor (ECF subfamily)
MLPAMDESALIARARHGDRHAFDRLVGHHLDRVWRTVWRIVRHEADAADVVQEVFLTAWRSIGDYRQEASLASWLHTIATSRALNHLDRRETRQSRRALSLENTEGEPISLPDRAPSPWDNLAAAELQRRLAVCVSELPASWQAVLALREGEQMSYQAIADRLQLVVGTVRSRLARSRQALLDCLRRTS